MTNSDRTTICVSPGDHYDLGGLIAPLILQRSLGDSRVVVAATRSVDMSAHGGGPVQSYRAVREAADGPLSIVHLAGASGTMTTLDALANTFASELDIVRTFDTGLSEAIGRALTGSSSPLAYVVDRRDFANASISFRSLDLTYVEGLRPSVERFLADQLASAEHVGIADETGLRWARRHHLRVSEEPPVLAWSADLIGQWPAGRSSHLPDEKPPLAVQFDHASLRGSTFTIVADELRRFCHRSGHSILLFGTGPDHPLPLLRRLAAAAGSGVAVFNSRHVEEILGLIRTSAGVASSDLDVRAIAGSFAVPRRSLAWKDQGTSTRARQQVRRWDPDCGDLTVLTDPSELGTALLSMLSDSESIRNSQRRAVDPHAWTDLHPSGTSIDGSTADRSGLVGSLDDTDLVEHVAATITLVARLRDLLVSALPDPTAPPRRDLEGYFDADYYVRSNPDLDVATDKAWDHYLQVGWREGRDPMPAFDTARYLRANPDVDQEPLGHYVVRGWREGRDPHRWFDVAWYLTRNHDVLLDGTEPLAHYLDHGWREFRDPSPAFDSLWYAEAYSDGHRIPELVTHVLVGEAQGRATAPPLPTTFVPVGGAVADRPSPPAVVVHLHYDELVDELLHWLDSRFDDSIVAYFTLTDSIRPASVKRIERFRGVRTVRHVENRGRDVLPFLLTLPDLLADQVEIAVKVHSKRSPQLQTGDVWRRSLLDHLAPSPQASVALDSYLHEHPDIGVAIPRTFTQPLSLHLRDNREFAIRAGAWLNLDAFELHDRPRAAEQTTPFPRGNMFWFRPQALAQLADVPADWFEPEAGQTDGTWAHALERLPAFVARRAGFETISYSLSSTLEPSTAAVRDV